MRLAGQFARRVRAWAAANGIPVIDCNAGQRKHRIADEHLASHSVGPGSSWSWSPCAGPDRVQSPLQAADIPGLHQRHVLRFEAITHNTRKLGCGRALERFPQIIARLAACASDSAPGWTASIPDSSPTARWTSCRGPRNWALPRPGQADPID
jgi:hypothetical protein